MIAETSMYPDSYRMSARQTAMHSLLAADAPRAGTGRLILAAVLGIAAVVALMTVVKMHPFVALCSSPSGP
jgi:hypothetical protein